MATIGQQLVSARKELGLSVDDVAHETRIHANVIRSIESDDFSMFASTTYARSFLKKYSEYLEIDVTEEIRALDHGTEVSLKNSELMDQVRDTLQNNRLMRREQPRRYRRKIEKPGGAPLFLGVILIILFVSIGVFYFLGYQAESPEELKSEITRNLNKAGDLLKPDETKTGDSTMALPSSEIPANPLAPKKTGPEAVPSGSNTTRPDATVGADGAIAKPPVSLELDESPLGTATGSPQTPRPAIVPPRPRETAAINLHQEQGDGGNQRDLPAVPRPVSGTGDNGGAAGEITDTVENPQPEPTSESGTDDAPAIRAVPIVGSGDSE